MTIVSEHSPSTRRNTELFLIGLATALNAGFFAMVGIGTSEDGSFTLSSVYLPLGLGVVGLVVHVVLRRVAAYADPVLLPIALALNGMGIAMIHRLDIAALAKSSDHASLAPKQLMWTVLGAVMCAAVLWFVRRHQALRAYTYTAMIASLLLLLAPLPFPPVNGARIWVLIGPFSFQPGEITKIVLTVFFAGYLVSNRDQLALAGKKFLGVRLPRGRDLGPLLVVWSVSIGVLVFQRDLGTSLLFFGLFVAMLYIATERWSWAAIALALFCSGAFVAWRLFSHVQKRVNAWLNTFDDDVYSDAGFQIAQGMYGMANGGLLGTGLGNGMPELTTYAESDMIYAALGEELGMVGLFAILTCFMVFIERAFRTAIGVRDGFGKLLAAGLGFVVCLQLFVVVGGITRVIPLTGLTLPFLAYGGSSLLANWMIVGLLLRISDAARRPTAPSGPKYVTEDGATAALDIEAMKAAVKSATPPSGGEGER